MLYEIYCRGHRARFKSAGGDAKCGKYFCGGCCKQQVRRFLKTSTTVTEFYDATLDGNGVEAEVLNLKYNF